MGITVDVTQPLNKQSTAIQQMVSIARAISIQARLVIMDESTSSLDEIFEICDRMVIIRDGKKIKELVGEEISEPGTEPWYEKE